MRTPAVIGAGAKGIAIAAKAAALADAGFDPPRLVFLERSAPIGACSLMMAPRVRG